MSKQRMVAEILFLNPDHVSPAVAALVDQGFDDVEILDWKDVTDDEVRPTVWIYAWTTSELNDWDFSLWTGAIVQPLGGDVVEAGFSKGKEADLAVHAADAEVNKALAAEIEACRL